MGKITNHKLISFHVAYGRGSKMYSETLSLVKRAYPDNQPFYQAAIAMALFHAGRSCHYQGYYRDELACRQGVGKGHRAYVENPSYQEQRMLNIQKYAATFKPGTIDCWLPVFRNKAEYLFKAKVEWEKAQVKRKVIEARSKLRREEVAQARKTLRERMH